MKTPQECYETIRKNVKKEWKTAFMAAVILGLLIHMPMLLSDLPNHDGLDSMYFDQNMITSGRWFLMIACGVSSYYSLPWLTGVLSILYLGLAAAALTEFLELKSHGVIIGISGLLVVFPAIVSHFAYAFTMDGYMMALLFAVLAALLTKKYRLGFLAGAVCLAFSLGIYQSYLPFAVLLCIYGIVTALIDQKETAGKIKTTVNYLLMGVIGVVLYFVILQVLLFVQGKELDTYQGISGMGGVETSGLLSIIKNIYVDFVSFTLKGNILANNIISAVALLLLLLLFAVVAGKLFLERKWWKSLWFYLVILLLAIILPVANNIILLISPEVTYHLLMRYQWVMYLILPAAFIARYGEIGRRPLISWGLLISLMILLLHYGVTDNIAYSNLQKRYEKTYAYCLRLLDRMEQTEGYYQGIPIAMIGVVSEEEYPETDITGDVTAGMIGISGDSLLYRSRNYQAFMKHYLGATLNFLPAEVMDEIYYSEEYRELSSFPGEDSIRIVDGIMYIKTENVDKTLDQ